MVARIAALALVPWGLAAVVVRQAEAQAVAGRLVDRTTRAAIRGVIVLLKDTSNVHLGQATSDTAGEFLLNLERSGRYYLDFRAGRTPLGTSRAFDVGAGEFHQRVFEVDAPREEPVYFEFQVAKQVEVIPPSHGPRYPPDLRERQVEGKVLVQFVVDTTGRPVRGTFRVLHSTDPAFTAAVEHYVWWLRFRPAELAYGQRVRQLVQMPFEFTLTW